MDDDIGSTQELDEQYDDTSDSPELEEPYDDAVSAEEVGREATDPDVVVDVRELKVDEIALDVEDLRAHVSLQAEVLDLLKLNVGVDVELSSVHLDIKGVEAQALLKVRLHNVARIVGSVLTTIDRNPQIIDQLAAAAGGAAGELVSGAGDAVGELGRSAGAAVGDVGRSAGAAVGDVGRHAEEAIRPDDDSRAAPRRPTRRRDQSRGREEQPP
jgi:hypothetical protein